MVIIEKKILELKCETFGEIMHTCNYDVFYYDVIVTLSLRHQHGKAKIFEDV